MVKYRNSKFKLWTSIVGGGGGGGSAMRRISAMSVHLSVLPVPRLRGWYIKYQEGALHDVEVREREWTNSELNFDNIFNGMLALFTISTFEGWPK